MSETEKESAMEIPLVVVAMLEMFADRVETISVDYSVGDMAVSYRVDLGQPRGPSEERA